MAMLCMECGETKKFLLEESRKIIEQVEVEVDGETEDEGKETVTDKEWDDTFNHAYKCGKCDGYNIEQHIETEEVLKLKWEHTGKTGVWYKRELLEKSRDPELAKALMAEKL